jgi:DNA-binding protein HU-beta
MNTGQLIESVAKTTKVSKATARAVVNTTFGAIQGEVKKGKKVTIPGFGTFSRVKRAARIAVSPATGQKIKVAAKRVPKFKAGSTFKKSVL